MNAHSTALRTVTALFLASAVAVPAHAGSRSGGFSRPSFRTSVPRISRTPSFTKPTVRSVAPSPAPAPKAAPAAPAKPSTSRPIIINRNYYRSSPNYSSSPDQGSSFFPSFLGSYLGTTLAQPNPAPAAPVIINSAPAAALAPAAPVAAPAPAPAYAQEDIERPDEDSSWFVWLLAAMVILGAGLFLIRRKAA